MRYTKAEKREIISTLKAAAVAVAEVWDVLRAVEVRTKTEINVCIGEILGDDLAPACNIPPSLDDLNDADVWEAFTTRAEVRN